MTYLGIDISTQQCKILAMNDSGQIIANSAINYQTDPRIKDILDTSSKVVTQKASTFKLALIFALEDLMKNFDIFKNGFQDVKAISGCGQQHGSVYFKNSNFFDSTEIYQNEDPEKFNQHFSFSGNCPIWMDTSTEKECQIIEEKFGKEHLKRVTGSYAFCRFTASQIMKRSADNQADYEKICLISSFGSSLLAGKFCPIDY